MSSSLYDQLVAIVSDYIGPAAERFVTRQVEAHLNIHPSQLSTQDISEITDWLSVTMSLLTPDTKMVDEFRTRVRALQ